MSIYARYKRNPGGFRSLVELLETTPTERRQKMIDVGMQEDAAYTEKAMSYMLNFNDILELPEMELAELIDKVDPRIAAFSIHQHPQEVKDRFLKCARRGKAADIRDYFDSPNVTLREIGGAQLKVVQIARQLEKQGYINTKKIPEAV